MCRLWRTAGSSLNLTVSQLVRVTVKPKVFKKLEQAQADYPMWVAAITGKIGERFDGGFVLDQPSIQVFERKPKEPKEATAAATT